MKFCLLFVSLCFPFIVTGQWYEEKDIFRVVKPDSVFWVDDLEKFISENDLHFLNERRENYVAGKAFYFLGNYERYSYAEIYETPAIAIKDKNQYRIWYLPVSVAPLTEIDFIDTIEFEGKKILRFEGSYFTAWSMMVPMTGNHCYKSVILIDPEQNYVVFSKVFTQYLDEIDENDVVTSMKQLNYHYVIEGSKIKFYKTADIDNCTEASRSINKEQVPDFYYEYIPKKRIWVKKIR